jgi:hypothetical protein
MLVLAPLGLFTGCPEYPPPLSEFSVSQVVWFANGSKFLVASGDSYSGIQKYVTVFSASGQQLMKYPVTNVPLYTQTFLLAAGDTSLVCYTSAGLQLINYEHNTASSIGGQYIWNASISQSPDRHHYLVAEGYFGTQSVPIIMFELDGTSVRLQKEWFESTALLQAPYWITDSSCALLLGQSTLTSTLYLLDTNRVQLDTLHAPNAQVYPDGNGIVLYHTRNSFCFESNGAILRVDSVTHHITPLLSGGSYAICTVSPDGSFLIVNDTSGYSYVLNPASGAKQRIADGETWTVSPTNDRAAKATIDGSSYTVSVIPISVP